MKSIRSGLILALVTGGALALAGTATEAATTKPVTAAAKPAAAAAPAAAAPAATTAPAAATAPVNIGTFKSWTAWKGKDPNGMICYISASPTKSTPDGLNRDPVHFLIVHRKGLNIKNEVQTLIGYTLKKDSKPTATVDKKTYPMIVDGAGAWLASTADEPGFVTALKSATTLTVKGTSGRGTDTVDTYALAGISAAMGAIDKACN